MRSRLIAFVIAVGMVAAAIVIRGRIDQHKTNTAHPLRLVCSNELQAACEALPGSIKVTYEPAATTAAALAGTTPPDIDGWLTTGPWPQIVRERLQRSGRDRLLTQSAPLARSPIIVVAFPDRAKVIKQNCVPLTLKCVGDLAGKGDWKSIPGGNPLWGPVKVALAPPDQEASGLVALGAATTSFFGRADLSLTDLDASDTFGAWLHGLSRAVRGDVLGQMIGGGGAAVGDFALTVEAVGKPLVDAAAQERRPSLLYPSSVTSADVVLGTFATSRSRRLADLVRASNALTSTGWRQPASTPSGLPPAGFLDALRAAWGEASR
jgi:hypothetical protein